MPSYLAIGVPYDIFMACCPTELEPYVKANRREIEMQNTMMYINGIYVADAIMSTLGNSQWFKGKAQAPHKYPEQPYKLFEEQDEMEEEQQKQRDLEQFFAQEEIRRANWKMKKMRERGELA